MVIPALAAAGFHVERPTSADTAERPAGTRPTTAIWYRFGHQPRAGPARSGLRSGPPARQGDRWPRFRLTDRGPLRNHPSRYLHLARHDERSLRGSASGRSRARSAGRHSCRPREPHACGKHYQWYYSTRQADGDMLNAPQGLHAFLRAYYHAKSADWPGKEPRPLRDWSAGELTRLPPYYVMPAEAGMAEIVAPYMPSETEIAACSLPSRARCALRRVRPHRIPGRPAVVPLSNRRAGRRRPASVRRAHHRRARHLYRRGSRLGNLPGSPGLFERLDRVCTDLRGRNRSLPPGTVCSKSRPLRLPSFSGTSWRS